MFSFYLHVCPLFFSPPLQMCRVCGVLWTHQVLRAESQESHLPSCRAAAARRSKRTTETLRHWWPASSAGDKMWRTYFISLSCRIFNAEHYDKYIQCNRNPLYDIRSGFKRQAKEVKNKKTHRRALKTALTHNHQTKYFIKEPAKVITSTPHPHPNNHYARWNIQYKFPRSNNEAFNYCELEPQWGGTVHHFNLSPRQQPPLLLPENLYTRVTASPFGNSFRSQRQVPHQSPWPISTFFFLFFFSEGGIIATKITLAWEFYILIPSVICGSLKANWWVSEHQTRSYTHVCTVYGCKWCS